MKDKAISVKILKHRLYTRYMDNPREFKALCELINNIPSVEEVEEKRAKFLAEVEKARKTS